jgi:hypothetical protein
MAFPVPTPNEVLEAVAKLRFPPTSDARMTTLMDRNNNGHLTVEERNELEAWVELGESWSLVRAQALMALGRKPQ